MMWTCTSAFTFISNKQHTVFPHTCKHLFCCWLFLWAICTKIQALVPFQSFVWGQHRDGGLCCFLTIKPGIYWPLNSHASKFSFAGIVFFCSCLHSSCWPHLKERGQKKSYFSLLLLASACWWTLSSSGVWMASNETPKKQLIFFIIILLFMSLLFFSAALPPMGSLSARRLLSSPSTTSMDVRGTAAGVASPGRFESRKHEVPSGPNPVTN